jgi:hypothetical protein
VAIVFHMYQMLENVLHAVSAMYSLLPEGRAAELAPRLLPALLGLRRRPGAGSVLPLAATRCLASVLAQLTSEVAGSTALEPGLDGLLSALSELVRFTLKISKSELLSLMC